MYRWELDGAAQHEFASLSQTVRATLAAFMDAVVIVDPTGYQRRADEPADPPAPVALRSGSGWASARCTSARATRAWSRSSSTRPTTSCSSSKSSGSATKPPPLPVNSNGHTIRWH
jgi:hypothetical protein